MCVGVALYGFSLSESPAAPARLSLTCCSAVCRAEIRAQNWPRGAGGSAVHSLGHVCAARARGHPAHRQRLPRRRAHAPVSFPQLLAAAAPVKALIQP